jgi:hypothetical protein
VTLTLVGGARFGHGFLFSAGFVSSAGVISSIGFGGGVVAIVQPIHAPIPNAAIKATKTGTAMIQNWTFDWVS